ncbi:MAG: beta-galactosidase [Anaerolineales bacterium]|nr:beta-galactosidase [Anaerolineales bacterium]
MSNFYAKDSQFWLNDEPILIQAGEFHYFRTPVDQWAHRLGLLKNAGFNTLATYIPWLWHQLEEGLSDFDGHSHPMRDLAGFLDLAAEMGFLIIARPGPYIMAETINEGIPPWVFQNYPQIAFTTQKGEVLNLASYLHPDFLACVRSWYQAVFQVLTPRQITRGGKIIMVQLDNEMGMPQWVRNVFDTNPDTLARFAAWVQNTYGTPYPAPYPAEHLPEFLHEAITNPQTARVAEDYRRFYRAYLREYTAFLWEEAKANGMEVPPIVNVHGFMNGGKTFPIGLSQLIEAIEMEGVISATDVYPITIGEGNFPQLVMVNEITKAVQNPQQALFSAEFEAGGNPDFGNGQSSFFDLHTRLCISTGMRAINHYLFCDGENDPVLSPVKRHDWGHPVRKDGSVRRHYHRYPKLSKVLQAYGTALVRAQPQTVATVGFLLDHFMTEVNNPLTQPATNVITHQREVILYDFIGRGLALTHRPFNALELTRVRLDPGTTPNLWVMMEKQCPAEVQEKLFEYAQRGGKLLLIGRVCEEDFNQKICTVLKEALGIEAVVGGEPFVQGRIQAFGYQDVPASFIEGYVGTFEEVFATGEKGETVGFVQTLGAGKVLVFGAALTANTLEDVDLVHQMALKMGCPPLFRVSEWVDVRVSQGEGGRFLYVNNYQDDPVEAVVEEAGEVLFGGHPVRLAARQGAILPLKWELNLNVLVHYLTSEVLEIAETDNDLILKTAHAECVGEFTVSGYRCEEGVLLQQKPAMQRFIVYCNNGKIILQKT